MSTDDLFILSLAHELILAIASYLNLRDLESLNQSCRDMRRITFDAYHDAAQNSSVVAIFLASGGLRYERRKLLRFACQREVANRHETISCLYWNFTCTPEWTPGSLRKAAEAGIATRWSAVTTFDLDSAETAWIEGTTLGTLKRSDGLVTYKESSTRSTITLHDAALVPNPDITKPAQKILSRGSLRWFREYLRKHTPRECEIIWPNDETASDLLSLPKLPGATKSLTIRNMRKLFNEPVRLKANQTPRVESLIRKLKMLETLYIEPKSCPKLDLKALRTWKVKILELDEGTAEVAK
ncbi:hypothetical protein M409DRAFT_61386 [Zasmidium cellare ATCC 36951]|uniref:F-box domain-containing protein n=1 Tax=Zasmidium cellare ATCC 36951 TaxID=1080233 RepID=A0A6A6BVA6_ZASCE|nr:uncharacterized protein M409DRAFT_61386 [Zasmidium cellare ATCC 36951]KAF2158727.1 hypothetical protein M409DRAFT_61386 [Zasmidium cellare ATCC 36951]